MCIHRIGAGRRNICSAVLLAPLHSARKEILPRDPSSVFPGIAGRWRRSPFFHQSPPPQPEFVSVQRSESSFHFPPGAQQTYPIGRRGRFLLDAHLRPLGHSKSMAYSVNGTACGAVSSTNVGLLALRRRAGTPLSRLFSPMLVQAQRCATGYIPCCRANSIAA